MAAWLIHMRTVVSHDARALQPAWPRAGGPPPARQTRLSESALDRQPLLRFLTLRQQIPSMSLNFNKIGTTGVLIALVLSSGHLRKKRDRPDWLATLVLKTGKLNI